MRSDMKIMNCERRTPLLYPLQPKLGLLYWVSWTTGSYWNRVCAFGNGRGRKCDDEGEKSLVSWVHTLFLLHHARVIVLTVNGIVIPFITERSRVKWSSMEWFDITSLDVGQCLVATPSFCLLISHPSWLDQETNLRTNVDTVSPFKWLLHPTICIIPFSLPILSTPFPSIHSLSCPLFS